jgi:type IV pilus assembly protein PilQ
VKRGLALFLTVMTAGVLLRAAGPATAPAVTDIARLTTISSRVSSTGTSLVIEATEPVGYISTRPDPLTIAIDFRNVAADGLANAALANLKSPIANVAVESIDAMGAPASRVRIALSQAVVHHVRSDRNTVIVDLDAPAGASASNTIGGRGLVPGPGRGSQIEILSPPSGRQVPAVDPMVALGLMAGPQTAGAAILSGGPAARPASAPQQRTAAPSAADQSTARRFTGTPISLDFQGADLRAVLRTFAEVSGLNIVIDPSVQGTVDVALRDVPWDQALDIILRANKLGYSVDGTIVRIAPLATLSAEEKDRSELVKAQADAGQLSTLTRQLSYSKGEEIVTLLKQANILSNRGQAFVDVRTNTLIVTDLQERLTSTTALIDTLDKPQPQVEIEARIVQTNKTYARQLGVQWGFNGAASPQFGNTTNLAFPNSVLIGGRAGVSQGATGGGTQGNASGVGTSATATAVNLGVAAASSAVGLTLGSVNGAFNLDVALSALESSGNGKVLSTPKVSTLNNVAAEMSQGVQIPIQTVANNTVTVTFKDAALKLLVTPQITAANTVIMQVQLENASPDYTKSVNNIPPIDTQRAITTVLVSDGQTTVIGGIFTSRSTNQTDTTPGLGNIPILKWLFKRDAVRDENTELLIFITPKIVKNQ